MEVWGCRSTSKETMWEPRKPHPPTTTIFPREGAEGACLRDAIFEEIELPGSRLAWFLKVFPSRNYVRRLPFPGSCRPPGPLLRDWVFVESDQSFDIYG